LCTGTASSVGDDGVGGVGGKALPGLAGCTNCNSSFAERALLDTFALDRNRMAFVAFANMVDRIHNHIDSRKVTLDMLDNLRIAHMRPFLLEVLQAFP
jgi:hypothetical protein